MATTFGMMVTRDIVTMRGNSCGITHTSSSGSVYDELNTNVEPKTLSLFCSLLNNLIVKQVLKPDTRRKDRPL